MNDPKKPARVGTDPKLDEDYISQLLRTVPTADNIGMIQQGAAQALLDMYDRGMTRGEFCENASSVLALYAQCAKLWMLANIKHAYDREPLTEKAFEEARTGIVELLLVQTAQVEAMMKRLRQCPTSEDPIH